MHKSILDKQDVQNSKNDAIESISILGSTPMGKEKNEGTSIFNAPQIPSTKLLSTEDDFNSEDSPSRKDIGKSLTNSVAIDFGPSNFYFSNQTLQISSTAPINSTSPALIPANHIPMPSILSVMPNSGFRTLQFPLAPFPSTFPNTTNIDSVKSSFVNDFSQSSCVQHYLNNTQSNHCNSTVSRPKLKQFQCAGFQNEIVQQYKSINGEIWSSDGKVVIGKIENNIIRSILCPNKSDVLHGGKYCSHCYQLRRQLEDWERQIGTTLRNLEDFGNIKETQHKSKPKPVLGANDSREFIIKKFNSLAKNYDKLFKRNKDVEDKLERILSLKDGDKKREYLYDQMTIALSNRDLVAKNSFFFEFLTNVIENFNLGSKNLFRWNETIIQFWLMVRFYAGKKALDVIRGASNEKQNYEIAGYNIPVPAASTLTKYAPTMKTGQMEDLDIELLGKSFDDNKIAKQVLLLFDATDIREGIVQCGSNFFVGGGASMTTTEFMDKAQQNNIDRETSSSMWQVFLTTATKTKSVCLPVAAYVIPKDISFPIFADQKLTLLNDSLVKHGFNVIGCSCNMENDNQTLAGNLQTKYNWKVAFDFSHVVKNLRNLLFNKRIENNGFEFSLNTLIQALNQGDFELSDQCLHPSDLMEMKAVLELIDFKVINFLLQTSFPQHENAIQELGKFLQMISNFYSAINDDLVKSEKEILFIEVEKYISNHESKSSHFQINPGLLTGIKSNIEMIKYLWSLYDEDVLTSAISTLVVENFFSILRRKHKYLDAKSYFETSTMAWFVQVLWSQPSDSRGWYLPNINHSKKYNNVNTSLGEIHLKPKEYHPKEKLTEDLINLLTKYKPSAKILSIRDVHTKITRSIFFPCPYTSDSVKECNRIELYLYPTALETHLTKKHNIHFENARSIVNGMKTKGIQLLAEGKIMEATTAYELMQDILNSNNIDISEQVDTTQNDVPDNASVLKFEDSTNQVAIAMKPSQLSNNNRKEFLSQVLQSVVPNNTTSTLQQGSIASNNSSKQHCKNNCGEQCNLKTCNMCAHCCINNWPVLCCTNHLNSQNKLYSNLKWEHSVPPKYVFVDIETVDPLMNNDCQIVEIGAISFQLNSNEEYEMKEFDKLAQPKNYNSYYFNPKSGNVSPITVKEFESAINVTSAVLLQDFSTFCKNDGGTLYIIGHNIRGSDWPQLRKNKFLEFFGNISQMVITIVDTIPIFCDKLKLKTEKEKEKHTISLDDAFFHQIGSYYTNAFAYTSNEWKKYWNEKGKRHRAFFDNFLTLKALMSFTTEIDQQTNHFKIRNQLYFSQEQVSTLLKIIDAAAESSKYIYYLSIQNGQYISPKLSIEKKNKIVEKPKLKRNKPSFVDDDEENQILQETLLSLKQKDIVENSDEPDTKKQKTDEYVDIELKQIRSLVEQRGGILNHTIEDYCTWKKIPYLIYKEKLNIVKEEWLFSEANFKILIFCLKKHFSILIFRVKNRDVLNRVVEVFSFDSLQMKSHLELHQKIINEIEPKNLIKPNNRIMLGSHNNTAIQRRHWECGILCLSIIETICNLQKEDLIRPIKNYVNTFAIESAYNKRIDACLQMLHDNKIKIIAEQVKSGNIN